MAKVIGIGGVFFKASDPERLKTWYQQHLGLEQSAYGGVDFSWRHADDPQKIGKTVWCVFPKESDYFGATNPAFMVNYIVDDLDGLLETLRAQGAQVDRQEDHEYGRFAWVTDPEGNRLELWEPPKSA